MRITAFFAAFVLASTAAHAQTIGEKLVADVAKRSGGNKWEHIATAKDGDKVRVYLRMNNEFIFAATCYPSQETGFVCLRTIGR